MKRTSGHRFSIYLLSLVFLIGISSCGIFKGKKKKCPTCPKWSIEVLLDAAK